MRRILIPIAVLLAGLLSARSAEYKGKVGKLDAVFSMEWHDDGSVSGSYHYPSRPGVSYSLEGKNPAEGELYLEEHHEGELTAKCYLAKFVTDGAIVWRGEMHNTDGRRLPMELSRAREATTPLPVANVAGENHYGGYIGRLAAEFSLSWHEDGTVSGSYHYPERPDTTYTIHGLNPHEGELFLAEYTGGELTARCLLHKRLEESSILWEGIMMNTDGRHFPMAFARTRGQAAPAGTLDEYEAKRRTLLASVNPVQHWDTFPLADAVVDRVPVHLEGGEYFGARITACRPGEGETSLTLFVADWDVDGALLLNQGREVTLRAARALPVPADALVGREITVLFAPDGSLFSLELVDIALTHVRRVATGKLEVRGVIDLFTVEDSFDWSPEHFAEKMRAAPVVEFLPDKLALDLVPERDLEFAAGEVFFQTIRLVRDHGLAIQATAAGPGSLELETLSLDPEPEPNPWISLKGLKEAVKAPPNQLTGQAG